MTPFDRQVRAQVYRLLAGGASTVDAIVIGDSRGWDVPEVEVSLNRLAQEKVIALLDGTDRVWMTHPFSGVETSYQAVISDQSWFANCAWDALAILALLGDGEARASGAAGRACLDSGGRASDSQGHSSRFWCPQRISGTTSDSLERISTASGRKPAWKRGSCRVDTTWATWRRLKPFFEMSMDWYSGRMDEDWDPPTPDTAEAIFAKHGLTGDFWKLS